MRSCPNCRELFETKDAVRATVITYYKALKSKVAYALEQPIDCEWIEHLDCNNRKNIHGGD